MRAQNAHIVQTEPLTPQEQLKKFKLPPGFAIELVVAEPDIAKPIDLKFDARGRLWLTDTLEYPYAVPDGKPGRDSLKIVEIDAASGKASRVKTFAKGLNIPIGLCPLTNGAIVFSIPNILHAPDADGDDIADSLTPIVGPFDRRDTHGLNNAFTRWIDGRVYACHGFSNQSQPKGTDGRTVTMHSGNTYRFRPDGTELTHWTHGQVNPFGNCFDAYGHLFTADCHSQPAYQLIPQAHYPSFGKPHDGLGFGPTLITHSHGSTGISGIVHYTADQFPAEFHENIFIGNPITHRINRDRLERRGGSLSGKEMPDFLSCDDPWFRPVDLQLGPDGALYVADFYNRIIGHYEVPLDHPQRDRQRGRVWRITYRGPDGTAPAPALVDCRAADLPKLIELLGHANLAVRTQATHEIVDRIGTAGLPALEAAYGAAGTSEARRAHLLWVLERLGSLGDERLKRGFLDSSPLVRVTALHVLRERSAAELARPELRELVAKGLQDDDGFVVRGAAEVAMFHPQASSRQALLAAWEATKGDDPQRSHTLKLALRNTLRQPGALADTDLALLEPPQARRLAEVLLAVPTAAAASRLTDWISRDDIPPQDQAPYLRQAARYAEDADVAVLAAHALKLRASLPIGVQVQWLKSWQQAGQERGADRTAWLKPLKAWGDELAARLLAATNEGEARLGIELAKEFRPDGSFEAIARLGKRGAPFGNLRGDALAACASQDPAAALPVLCEIVAGANEAVPLRQRAVQLLAGRNDAAARLELLNLLKVVPEAIAIEIALNLASSRDGATEFLAAVEQGKAPAVLLAEGNVAQRFALSRPVDWQERVRKLTAGLPPRDDRVKKILQERRTKFAGLVPDVEKGKAVFTKHCAACHKLAGQGQKIGPELDGIGQRGLDRLLEDVLEPSRNVDQAFRSTQVQTLDGRVLQGLLLREEGQVLILADAQGKEVRVPADEVETRGVSALSPMPANVIDLVPEDEFLHLVAYLLTHTQK